jgi:hypothetical protein
MQSSTKVVVLGNFLQFHRGNISQFDAGRYLDTFFSQTETIFVDGVGAQFKCDLYYKIFPWLAVLLPVIGGTIILLACAGLGCFLLKKRQEGLMEKLKNQRGKKNYENIREKYKLNRESTSLQPEQAVGYNTF